MNHQILLVEDEEPIRNAIAEKLRRLRFEVHCAADKEEAEALLATYEYALVLSDLFLPTEYAPGLALIEQATSAPYCPKLVALTGHRTPEMELAARERGAEAFVPKPVSLMELGMLVQALVNEPQDRTSAALPAIKSAPLWDRLITPGGVSIYMQPIFAAQKREIVAVECLARGPQGTPFERADTLFDYARRKRGEPIFDRHCLRLALEACRSVPTQIRISLNTHASTLAKDPALPNWLAEQERQNGIEPARVTVEIVEHSPAWNQGAFLRSLDALRKQGMRIALDDIGLGNSNFHMILDAHPDYLKIDRYLVKGAASDVRRRAVLAAVAKLAGEFGAAAVAEGVDNPADLEAVVNCGIATVQGFLFCRPFPIESQPHLAAHVARGCSARIAGIEGATCPLAAAGICGEHPAVAVSA